MSFLNEFGRKCTVSWSDLDMLFCIPGVCCECGQCNAYSLPQCMLESLITLNTHSFIRDHNESRNRTKYQLSAFER